MSRRAIHQIQSTAHEDYADLLLSNQGAAWKRLLDVQAPYRRALRRLKPGFTLDVGCGIGRNLVSLNGQGVGVDHNPHSIGIARQRGLAAFTPQEFQLSEFNTPERFDSILLAHVAEHMTLGEAIELLTAYVPLLKVGGRLIAITPQEAGFRSDPTHVEFMDFEKLRRINGSLNLVILQEFSFPFPRWLGHLFVYNEFVAISRKGPDRPGTKG